jgi:hypothetical protein
MKKYLLATVVALVGLSLVSTPLLVAQANAGQITIKDPAEYNSYQNAVSQTSPQAKASACEAFLTAYPQSVVKTAVLNQLLDAYTQFDASKAVDAANRLLQVDPSNLKALYLIAFIKKQQATQVAASNPTQQAQLLDDAAAAAQKGLALAKPDGVTDDAFKKQKATTDPFFHSVIAYDDIYSKKDLQGAITEFRTELEMLSASNPAATQVAPALNDTLVLGQTYTQLKPADMINGVWFMSRAEDFAPANFKPVIEKQAKYWYKRFHGGEDGYDAVMAASAKSVFPPQDFKIAPAPTPKEIADKFVADNPDFTTYAMGDSEYVLANASPENAEKLFATLKDKVVIIPGTVISADANQIKLAVTDDAKADKVADFTINMKKPLADKDIPAVGSDVKNLVGTYDSYTQTPPQIIMRDGEFQVEKKPVTHHKPAAGHHSSN